jgi:hypothetical protein
MTRARWPAAAMTPRPGGQFLRCPKDADRCRCHIPTLGDRQEIRIVNKTRLHRGPAPLEPARLVLGARDQAGGPPAPSSAEAPGSACGLGSPFQPRRLLLPTRQRRSRDALDAMAMRAAGDVRDQVRSQSCPDGTWIRQNRRPTSVASDLKVARTRFPGPRRRRRPLGGSGLEERRLFLDRPETGGCCEATAIGAIARLFRPRGRSWLLGSWGRTDVDHGTPSACFSGRSSNLRTNSSNPSDWSRIFPAAGKT